jgi:hypothetical protein
MGLPVLIYGKSGSGKTYSLQGIKDDKVEYVSVLNKPLPFKGRDNINISESLDAYGWVSEILKNTTADIIVIDDATHLITNQLLKNHSTNGVGNAIFTLHNTIAETFCRMVEFIKNKVDDNKIVYVIMNESKNEFGDTIPKTIGKQLDEKLCVESLFSVVLRATFYQNEYVFMTNTNNQDVSKSPEDMFYPVAINGCIENNLDLVDYHIRRFYELDAPQLVSVPTPKVEPKIRTSRNTNIETITTPVEPKVEPKIEPKIEPKVEPKIEPKVEPKVEPKIEPNDLAEFCTANYVSGNLDVELFKLVKEYYGVVSVLDITDPVENAEAYQFIEFIVSGNKQHTVANFMENLKKIATTNEHFVLEYLPWYLLERKVTNFEGLSEPDKLYLTWRLYIYE